MSLKIQTLAILVSSAALAACSNISDAPRAGTETFRPVSNNAYHVQAGPYVDRAWIERREVAPDAQTGQAEVTPRYTK